MARIIISPYKKGLESTRYLREAGCLIKNEDSVRRPRRGRSAVAWGKQPLPVWHEDVNWINHPSLLGKVTNKQRWYELMDTNSMIAQPQFTTDQAVAQRWAGMRKAKVLCRETVTGSQGEGIVVARNPDQVIEAPVYTRYIEKVREFRVVAAYRPTETLPETKIGFIKSKRRTDEVRDRDDLLIRTSSNGWVYQDESIEEHPAVSILTHRVMDTVYKSTSISCLALDIVQKDDGSCHIIEANTAWGLNEESAVKTKELFEWIIEQQE